MNYKINPLATIKQPSRSSSVKQMNQRIIEQHPLKIVDIAQQQEGNVLKYCFLYEDGSSSPEMEVEIPEGKKGKDGEDGKKGKEGKKGKDAPFITEIKAYARQWIISFSDGTELKVPVKFPQDRKDMAGLAFGGQRPPVQNIIAGDNITVTEKNGVFKITSTASGSAGDWVHEDFLLDATDISNSYIDLANTPIATSEFVFLNGQLKSPLCDYTVSGNRITWTTTQPKVGSTFMVKYQK